MWKHLAVLSAIVVSGCTAALWGVGTAAEQAESAPPTTGQDAAIEPPLVVRGTQWTFHTAPPAGEERRIVSAHPRLLFTKEDLGELREKLSSPVYASDVAALRASEDALEQALCFQLWGDETKGEAAKRACLAGGFPEPAGYGGFEKSGDHLYAILLYDWTAELMSPEQRRGAFARVRSLREYGHRTAKRSIAWYGNDDYARTAATYYVLVALAGYGDGAADGWCEEVLDAAYDGHPNLLAMYDAEDGASLLDVLNSISLDSGGGSQMGQHESLATGYQSMYLTGAPVLLAGWQSATGEPVWSRCLFVERFPRWCVYELNGQAIGSVGLRTLEYCTGLCGEEMAALARWLLAHYGRDKYGLPLRLVLGDLRVAPKSPAELDLPVCAYQRGASLWVSRTNWSEEATQVKMQVRYLDTNRFESATGTLAVYRGDRPLLVRGIASKQQYQEPLSSALWVWDDDAEQDQFGQGSTYWDRLHNYTEPTHRARHAREVANDPAFRAHVRHQHGQQGACRWSRVEFSKMLKVRGCELAERTVLHVTGEREFVVVRDRVHVAEGELLHAVGYRLAEAPAVEPGRFRVDNLSGHVLRGEELEWVGGAGKEIVAPWGVWVGNRRGGYTPGYSAADPDKVRSAGLGTLYVRSPSPRAEYLVVLELGGPGEPPSYTDGLLDLGGCRIKFAEDSGDFELMTR